MIFALVNAFFLSQARAQDYTKYDFLNIPAVYAYSTESGIKADFQKVCAEIKYNYVEEQSRLDELQIKIHELAQLPITDDRTAEIEKIKNEIHEHAEHLIFLAKPEWNTEFLQLTVLWFASNYRPYSLSNVQVLSARFKNQQNGSIIQNLRLGTIGFVRMAPENSPPFFWYRVNTTYLEACQSTSTLEFEVSADYECLSGDDCGKRNFLLRGVNP